MHGWFLPALGLALLGGAGVLRLPGRLRPLVVGVLFVDVLVFNQLQNPLAFARQSFDELYGAQLRSFDAQIQAARPAVERLYGQPLAAVGYRNHPLQSRVETTYGYNPLELARYAAYAQAAEHNPRLVDGLAATHLLVDGLLVEANPNASPRAFFAGRVTTVPDDDRARRSLAELDPRQETIVVGEQLRVESDPAGSASVIERSEDQLTVHYRTASPNLLRVAIPAFPGWRASVNGVELTVLTVDHALIGVVVPAGEDDLHMWYAPRWFGVGATISVVALLATIAVLAASRVPRQAQ
jgi:hypothetical protein